MRTSQDVFGNVISVYTQDEAISDGVLISVGTCGHNRVVFTSNLFNDGYEDSDARMRLIAKGLKMLNEHNPDDTDFMRLRVIEEGRIWVIHDGNGLTFMKPEDY